MLISLKSFHWSDKYPLNQLRPELFLPSCASNKDVVISRRTLNQLCPELFTPSCARLEMSWYLTEVSLGSLPSSDKYPISSVRSSLGCHVLFKISQKIGIGWVSCSYSHSWKSDSYSPLSSPFKVTLTYLEGTPRGDAQSWSPKTPLNRQWFFSHK